MSVLFKAVVLSFFLLCGNALAEAAAQPAAQDFSPEHQILPQLEALEQKASTEQKLVLLVLGAGWCHDSVALMRRFNEPVFSAALSKRFEIAFIDVGYLQFGQATTQRYQLPLYYGTPTVMIIAPDSGQLLNKTDLMRWTNAASLNEAEYQQYFLETNFQQQFAQEQRQLAGVSAQLLQQITEFEQQQATKLMLAYAHIGPLLQAYKASGKPAGTEFKRSWDEVKEVRSRVLSDVQQLQQQAKTLAAGESLVLPQYPAFSFDTK